MEGGRVQPWRPGVTLPGRGGPRAEAGASALTRWAPLATIVVAAGVLRFSTLDLQSFWFDESVTVIDTLKPGLLQTLESVSLMEATPPLYFALVWLWSQAFGLGEAGLRSLSALAGTLTVLVAYFAAARLLRPRPALCIAALVAVHPLFVWYSQEARPYALVVLFGALSFLFFVQALQDGSRRALALWALSCGLALATHYFAFFLVGIEAAWLIAVAVRRSGPSAPSLRPTLLASGAVAAVAAVLLPLALYQSERAGVAWVGDLPGDYRLEQLGQRFLVGTSDPLGEHWLGGLVFLATLAVSGFVLYRIGRRALRAAKGDRSPGPPVVRPRIEALRTLMRERESVRIGLIVGGGALALPAFAALAGTDYFYYRYLLVAWIPLAIGIAGMVAGRRRLAVALACVAIGGSLAIDLAGLIHAPLQRDDWRAVAAELGPVERPRAVVVAPAYAREPLFYYGQPLAGLPPEGLRVSEIVLVGGLPVLPQEPPAGFRRVEQRNHPVLRLIRLRSDAPRRVSVRSLSDAFGLEPESVRLQLPASARR